MSNGDLKAIQERHQRADAILRGEDVEWESESSRRIPWAEVLLTGAVVGILLLVVVLSVGRLLAGLRRRKA